MKHVNYLSFFLLTLFSISFISCSDDDDNKLNTGITNLRVGQRENPWRSARIMSCL